MALTPERIIEITENEPGDNNLGLEDEADTISTIAPSETAAAVVISGGPKKKWSDSEIISKLKSGDLKEVENTKSKKPFWKIDKEGEKTKIARCNRCKSLFRYANGTSSMSQHECGGQSSAISKTLSIVGYFAKTAATVSPATKTKFGKALAYFCAKDMRPFEAVNGKGFQKVSKKH